MAKYKATVSFSGIKISMQMGEVREISDPALVENLLKAGQIVELVETQPKAKAEAKAEPEAEPKEEPKKSSRKGKTS